MRARSGASSGRLESDEVSGRRKDGALSEPTGCGVSDDEPDSGLMGSDETRRNEMIQTTLREGTRLE